MSFKNWKQEVFTIPNLLSILRLLLLPVYLIIYLNANTAAEYYIAGGILAVSCLTDLLDGQIARRFHMISNVGKILDPIADKTTQFVLILSIAMKQPILWPSIFLFIIKEGYQILAGLIAFYKGKMLKGALFSGKLCTTVLFISLIIMVTLPSLPNSTIRLINTINIIFMLNALFHYIATYAQGNRYFRSIQDHIENP